MSESFTLELDKFVAKAKIAPVIVLRKVALDLTKSIVLKTPVGNPSTWQSPPPAGYVGGRARASWGVGLNRISDDVQTTVTDPSGAKTIIGAAETIANAKADDTIFIGSRLPYIVALEYGHSQRQAPFGMVRVSVANFQAFVNAAVRSLPK